YECRESAGTARSDHPGLLFAKSSPWTSPLPRCRSLLVEVIHSKATSGCSAPAPRVTFSLRGQRKSNQKERRPRWREDPRDRLPHAPRSPYGMSLYRMATDDDPSSSPFGLPAFGSLSRARHRGPRSIPTSTLNTLPVIARSVATKQSRKTTEIASLRSQ